MQSGNLQNRKAQLNTVDCLQPRITIVTPSFNHGQFIEETILSVINQNYSNLEYIIIDGGSKDDTVQIIKKYEKHISYWVSEPDKGQSHAINKGFGMATGEIGMWLCSDDKLCDGALSNFISDYYSGTDRLYIGKGYQIDKNGGIIKEIEPGKVDNIVKLLDLKSCWRAKNRDSILQQSVLFPVRVFKDLGGVNEKRHYTMDFELWGRFFLHGLQVQRVNTDIGMFRWYPGQKTSLEYQATRELTDSALALLCDSKLPEEVQKNLKKGINQYRMSYLYHHWRSRIGIKRRLKNLFKQR